jgi:hypothetical protein
MASNKSVTKSDMKPEREACQDVINAFKNEACWGNKRLEHPDVSQRNKYKRKILKGMCKAAGILTREREARIAEAFPNEPQKDMLKGIVAAITHGLPEGPESDTIATIATAALAKAGVASSAPSPVLMVSRPHLHRRDDQPGLIMTIFREYGDIACKGLTPTAAFPGWNDETKKELLCEVIGACRLQLWFHFKDGKSHIDTELAKILSDKSTPDKQAIAFSRYLKSLKKKSDEVPSTSAPTPNGTKPKPKTDCKFFLEGKCKHGDSCTYAHNPEALATHRSKSTHKAECHFHFTDGKSCKHGPDGLKEVDGKTCAFSHKRILKPKQEKQVADADGFVKTLNKSKTPPKAPDKSTTTVPVKANTFAILDSDSDYHSDHSDQEETTTTHIDIKQVRKPAPIPAGMVPIRGKKNWDEDSDDEA